MPTYIAPGEIDFEYEKVMKSLDSELRDIRKGLSLDPTFKTDDEISGKRKLEIYEEIIYKGYKNPLNTFQKEFVDRVIQANSKSIVGSKDWERFGVEICEEHGWNKDIEELLACTAPRRAGKTWALARCVAARIELMALYNGSGHEDIQVVCSTGKRISTLFKECVMKFLNERNMMKYVAVNNVEVIIMQGPNGARAKGQFLPQPQHEEGLRGISANAILLEEGGFMGERVWYQVVGPLLTIKNSILIIISSPPKDRGHWFTALIDIIPTLKIVFICDACIKEWRDKKGKLEICVHKMKYFPSHHESSRQKKLKEIYKSREESFAREILGVALEDDRRLFTDSQIDGFLKREYVFRKQVSVPFIVVNCDPNVTNSPTSDEMAIVASTQLYGNYVVLGMTSHRTGPVPEPAKFLRAFLKALRDIPQLGHCPIYFSCERNSGHDASDLARVASRPEFQPVLLYVEDLKCPDDTGKQTTNRTKVNEARATQKILKTSKPGFLKDWVCTNPFHDTKDDFREIMKGRCLEQMSRYNVRISASTRDIGNPTFIVTGKVGPNDDNRTSHRYHDDLMVCLAMNVGFYKAVTTESLKKVNNYVSDNKRLREK